jgi:hypothetical protein
MMGMGKNEKNQKKLLIFFSEVVIDLMSDEERRQI